nr:MAG TPA: hypothetical protein [Caudoviricetes sp.]
MFYQNMYRKCSDVRMYQIIYKLKYIGCPYAD